jgi:DNA-binding XRE family transcriptional regulator
LKRREYSIKDIRNDLGISQQKLADEININRTYLSAIEAGHFEPSTEILIKIARAFTKYSGKGFSYTYTDLYKEVDN